MAVLEFEWGKSLKKSVEYVTKERGDEDVFSAEGCSRDTAVDNFRAVKKAHNKEQGLQTFLLMQSWSPEESKLKTPEEFHAMGKKLVEELYPGHQYVIRTHTDKGHIHNHIAINTINSDTGKRIENKYFWKNSKTRLIDKLRGTNDRICLENGLSVINKEALDRKARIPIHAQKAERFGSGSWLMELADKANQARALSTSYDEYVGFMKTLNVDVRVENKNISYVYPGRKPKRGSKLGKLYDKPGLEESFRANDKHFAQNPGLKEMLWEQFHASGFQPRRHSGRDPSGVLLERGSNQSGSEKDYKKFTPAPRPGRSHRYDSERELGNSIVPIGELARARRSIPEYCKANKIALTTNEKGQTVLKGKEFVVIADGEFTNTRNKRVGSLIEFVSIHKNCTYLQSVAHINKNPRLLLLEEYIGAQSVPHKSFYIPKNKEMDGPAATRLLSRYLGGSSRADSTAHALLQSKLAQVSKAGAIHLFGKDDDSGGLELAESAPNAWTEKRVGRATKPFYSGKPKGRTVTLFTDAKSFLSKHGDDVFGRGKPAHGVVALLSPDHKGLDRYLSEHTQVSQIQIVTKGKTPTKDELDFFGILKNRYKHHSIEVTHAGPDHELARDRGPDLSL